MKPIESPSWRQSPFIVGRRYRVQHDFTAQRENCRAAEILTFHSDAYSRYDSYTGYFFSQPDMPQLRVWDIHDNEDWDTWRTLFEEMPSDATHVA